MEKGKFAEAVEENDSYSWGCDTNWIGNNYYHEVCAICLNKILLQETALVKGCEHAFCVTCILRWASCKKEPTCPQCKTRFHCLNIHRALDGSIRDYMFEESVCLLLRASWFKTLFEVEKEELEKIEESYNYYDEGDDSDEYYFSSSPCPQISKLPWGQQGYVSVGRREAMQPKIEMADKEVVGRRAKRALKRESFDKAVEKHEKHLARLGRLK